MIEQLIRPLFLEKLLEFTFQQNFQSINELLEVLLEEALGVFDCREACEPLLRLRRKLGILDRFEGFGGSYFILTFGGFKELKVYH